MRSLILIGVLLGGMPLRAQETPPSIDKLVEQLGSRSFPERERASKALRERGPSALPAVRKALDSNDEEVRTRAAALIPAMEIAEALMPTRITYAAKGEQLGNILKEIEKQAKGLELRVNSTGGKQTVEFKDTPFWDAIERLHSAENPIAVSVKRESDRYSSNELSRLADKPAYAINRGPMRLEMTWIHEDRDLDLTGSKERSRDPRLTLSITVLAEPRITFLHIAAANVIEALDSDGKSLLEPVVEKKTTPKSSARTPAFNANPFGGRGTFRGESLQWTDIRLQRASETAKSIKLVRGSIPVKVILIRKKVVVSSAVLKSNGVSIKAGMETLQVTKVMDQGNNSFEIEISVPSEDYDGPRTRNNWTERFAVEDDAGNRYETNGSGSRSNGKQYWISMYYAPSFNKKGVGPPTKLIFEDWIIHEFEIPFEFKDVPLP